MDKGLKNSLSVLAFLLGLLVFLNINAHCATTSSIKHGNSLGATISQDNPNTYREGAVLAVAYVGSQGHEGLVVRIQPRGTYALFTEDLLICGAPIEKFEGKTNPMVLVYETVAHSSVEGVGCHQLKIVDEVKATHELP